MNPKPTQVLRSILSDQRVAALGTLHAGVPCMSMVRLRGCVTPAW